MNSSWDTSITWAECWSTVDDWLSVQIDTWILIMHLNVESISKSWSWCLSPTWTTIMRDMLILGPTHVVLTVRVSPIKVFWELIIRDGVLRKRRENDWLNLFLIIIRALRASSEVEEVLLLAHLILKSKRIVILPLFFRGDNVSIDISLSPSISRNSPRAVWLNTQIVIASLKSEVSVLSPVCSPWVSHSPELISIIFTPSNNFNVMISCLYSCSVMEDTTSVV